jgi:hypothetical protein
LLLLLFLLLLERKPDFFLFRVLIFCVVRVRVLEMGSGSGDGVGDGVGYDIGGADVQRRYFAVIVEITPGKGILAAFLPPVRVAKVALAFATKLVRFMFLFAFLVSLWGVTVSRVSV